MVTDNNFDVIIPLLIPQDAYPTAETNGTPELQQSSDMQRILLQILYLLSDSGVYRNGESSLLLLVSLLLLLHSVATTTVTAVITVIVVIVVGS